MMSPDGFYLNGKKRLCRDPLFVIKVTDNSGAFDTKTFSLTINNVNDPPVLEA